MSINPDNYDVVNDYDNETQDYIDVIYDLKGGKSSTLVSGGDAGNLHVHDSQYLAKGNVEQFIPEEDYDPATKKYAEEHGPVLSVHGRTGVVTAATGDYNASQVTNAFDKSSDTTDALSDAGAAHKFITQKELDKLASIEANAQVNRTPAQVKADYEGNGDTNPFTDALKSKLEGLENPKSLGMFTSLEALLTAYPNPAEGSFAFIDEGLGQPSKIAVWDVEDAEYSVHENHSAETPETIRDKYESNDDVNRLTNALKNKIDLLGITQYINLDSIEPGAEVNHTAGEIQALYEAIADVNRFTNASKAKVDLISITSPKNLDTIENGAQVNHTASQIASLYEGLADRNQFTDALLTKLTNLQEPLFLGIYANVSALALAHPSPIDGSYAYIDAGAGADTEIAVWDSDDNDYVVSTGGTAETAESIKAKYESNANTNALTDALLTIINTLNSGGNITNHFHSDDRNRANHTGVQSTGTIAGLADFITNNSTLQACKSVTDLLVVTGLLDLDALASAVATNNSKVSYPSADSTKVAHLTVTSATNLDSIRGSVTANDAFRTTPSDVILAGDNISWSAKTLNVSKLQEIQKNGVKVADRDKLNFIEGSNVALTITDDAANSRMNISIESTGGGAPAKEVEIVTVSRSLTIADHGKLLIAKSASNIQLTIDPATTTAYPDDYYVDVYRAGSGAVELVDTDVALYGVGKTIINQFQGMQIFREAVDVFHVVGAVSPEESGETSFIEVSTSRAITSTDSSSTLKCTNTDPITLTVPLDATETLPVGATLTILMYGTGAVTLAPEGANVIRASGDRFTINAQYEEASLQKLNADEWLLIGAIKA